MSSTRSGVKFQNQTVNGDGVISNELGLSTTFQLPDGERRVYIAGSLGGGTLYLKPLLGGQYRQFPSLTFTAPDAYGVRAEADNSGLNYQLELVGSDTPNCSVFIT